ncbi:hypothetical protein ACX6BF_15200, partial [Acinetobacter baumannii]
MLKKRSLSIEPFYYWWQDRVFIAAIILAILLHIFVLLIHFAMPAPSEQSTKEIASVHDKFHRTLILSGFCLLKIAKISLNSS